MAITQEPRKDHTFQRVFVLDDAQPREYQAYQGFFAFRAGRGSTSGATGATRPSFGNVDDDAPEELVVSFPGESSHELHIFDDMHSGGLQVFFGGLQFVTASDEDDIWIAAPGH